MNKTIYEVTKLGGTREVIRCRDCGRWVDSAGGVVLHSKRCLYSLDVEVHGAGAQTGADCVAASKQVERARLAKEGLVSTAFNGDEDAVVSAVTTKQITTSDAMNRDD